MVLSYYSGIDELNDISKLQNKGLDVYNILKAFSAAASKLETIGQGRKTGSNTLCKKNGTRIFLEDDKFPQTSEVNSRAVPDIWQARSEKKKLTQNCTTHPLNPGAQ
ncbi:hypothetical protein YC2023_010838 [Brassica napus]